MGLVDHADCPKLECGVCYALFQEHNRFDRCNCVFCRGAQLIPIHQKDWITKVSTLNVCDRCETPATSMAMGSFTKRYTVEDRVDSFELCPGCVADFVAFMEAKGVTERPRAYKTAYKAPEEPDTEAEAALKLLRAIGAGKVAAEDVRDATDAVWDDDDGR